MEVFWYSVIALLLVIFFILDGYDFGAGIIHLFFAKKEADKVLVAKSAGLFWDSNEVWLVAAGGMLFMAFPTFYAAVFSGFYLPLMLVLWLIVFRAIGLEFRGQFDFSLWKDIWDRSFGVASLLLALFFGIALGNVVRGVNLGAVSDGASAQEAHYFFLPLWNAEFSPLSENPGVIDWFTSIIGVIAVVTLTIHGANWIILKTNASINDHLKRVVIRLSIALALLTPISILCWLQVRPDALINFTEQPLLLFFPLIYLSGLVGLLFTQKVKREAFAFLSSTLVIIGGITSSIASLFPVMLPSTNAVNESLSIYSMAAAEYGLSVAFIWGLVGFVLIIVYFIVQKRLFSGKIDAMDYGH
jgi:cytochrome d ubiquinol oxidase subunit II